MKYLILFILMPISILAQNTISGSFNSGGECEETIDSRNAILTLRNSSGLISGCTYCIDDYSRGCLSNVVKICVLAESSNQLSRNAEVFTTLNIIPFAGKYDITLNRVTELHDNRGNSVFGTGVEVDRFPWYETAWRDNTIEAGTDLLCDCNPIIDIDDNKLESRASLDIRGATGFIRASTFSSGSLTRFSNSQNLSISNAEVSTRAVINGISSIDTFIYYSTISDNSVWTITGQTNARLWSSEISSFARISYSGGTLHYIYYSNITGYTSITHTVGEMSIFYSSFNSRALLTNSGGELFIYSSNFDSGGRLTNSNNDTRVYSSQFSSLSSVIVSGSNNKRLFYMSMDRGILNLTDAATVVYAFEITSDANVSLNGGNHYRGTFDTFFRFASAFNTRSVYGKGSIGFTASAANTNRGADYFNNNLQ